MIYVGYWIEVNGQFHKIPDNTSLYFYSSGRWSYKPINITKNILSRNNFTYTRIFINVDSYCLSYSETDFIRIDIYNNNTICIDNNTISYVHELQNYYKKLTGKELPITF